LAKRCFIDFQKLVTEKKQKADKPTNTFIELPPQVKIKSTLGKG